MVESLEVTAPQFIYPSPGRFRPKAMAAFNTGFWMFNQKPGETDEMSAKRCAVNMALGASREDIDQRWPNGIPTFESSYARFPNSKPLLTNIPDWGPSGGCLFVVSRTMDATVGATSNDRAYMGGTYGGNSSNGFGLEFSTAISSQVRAIDYNAAGGIETNSVDMGSSITDLQKWRVYLLTSGVDLQARNMIPADGTPNPTPEPLVGSRRSGSQQFSIGGRISDTVGNYTPTVHKDIALVALFTARPSGDDAATLAAQLALIATRMGNTMGT